MGYSPEVVALEILHVNFLMEFLVYQGVCLRVLDHFQAKNSHRIFQVAQLLENAPNMY